MKFGTPVKISQPLFVTIFMTFDARFVILWDLWDNFRKILAIVLKLHTNMLYRSRNFGIEFGQNRLKRSNFSKFCIF